MGAGSRRTSDGDCPSAGSQSGVGLPGAGAATEDGPTQQFADRWSSSFAGGGEGVGAARLDRTGAGAELGGVVRTFGRTGGIDQGRCLVASVEQMASHVQKKPCTPASKNARTYRRHGKAGSRGSP